MALESLRAKFNCRACTGGQTERLERADDQTEQQRMRGCHTTAIAPSQLDGEDLLRCPIRLVDWPAVNPVLALWPHLTKGRFPCGGGYADQPALFVDLLAVVDQLSPAEPAGVR